MKSLITFLAFFLPMTLFGQTEPVSIYDPNSDAAADIKAAVKVANAENKHVFIQVGGNWCSWCILFHNQTTTDAELDSVFNANFVRVKVNYSKENRNYPVLADLDYPQRFGFPVFVILDGKGNRLHTQNSVYLEEGKGHSKKKIMDFIKSWTPKAVDPENYKQE